MRPSSIHAVVALALLLEVSSGALPCRAERGHVVVVVQDAQGLPVRGVEIKAEGLGGSGLTGDDGAAKLSVGNGAKEGDWISLIILHSP